MLKPIRVAKLLAGNLGSNETILAEMNPNTNLYLSDKRLVDIDSMSIEDLERILDQKKYDALTCLANKYGKKIHILNENEYYLEED
jgi:hypothetical protein